jgi:hypothetical protein
MHRDLKSANVLLTRAGIVKIAGTLSPPFTTPNPFVSNPLIHLLHFRFRSRARPVRRQRNGQHDDRHAPTRCLILQPHLCLRHCRHTVLPQPRDV